MEISSSVNRQAQAEEANKHKVGGKIPSRPGYGNLFSCRVLFGLFFKVPALSSDSEGAVVRIHSSYAVPSSTNYCHYNILPIACTLKADSSDISTFKGEIDSILVNMLSSCFFSSSEIVSPKHLLRQSVVDPVNEGKS